jgi:hypothetical protein
MRFNPIPIVVLMAVVACTIAQEPSKNPISFSGRYSGCADIFVFRATEDKTKVIVVDAGKSALNVSSTPQTFDIASNTGLKVYMDDFGTSEYSGYCTDEFIEGAPKPLRIPATGGKVTIYIAERSEQPNKHLHRVSVELRDVSFQAPGDKDYVEKVEMKDVLV